MDKYIGIKFQSRPCLEVEVTNKYGDKYYQVKETDLITGEVNTTTLLTHDDIQRNLDNQEFIIEKNNKAIKSHKEREVMAEIERQKELTEQLEYENVYGYLDNRTPMQKGKILKILNVKTHYYNNGEYIGYMTRKDFLYKMLTEENYTITHERDLRYWGKNYEMKVKANEYRLFSPDESFYEITKTEYDYAKYLINNVIADKTA